MAIRIRGGDKLRRQLETLGRQMPQTVRSGMINLGFAVRDEIRDHVARAFAYSNDSTRKFVSGTYRFQYRANGEKFEGRIYPAGKMADLLGRHVNAVNTVTPADRADIVETGRMLIPSPAVPRNKRGQVPQKLLPDKILQRNARGQNRAFWTASGELVMYRPTKTAAPQVAYVARRQTHNPRAIDVQAVADRAVEQRAGRAFAEAINRQLKKFGVVK